MRKNYVKPALISEEFLASEYIAACYWLICNTEKSNTIEDNLNNSPWGGHDNDYCGAVGNTAININPETGQLISAEEINSPYGNLGMTFYTDETYQTQIPNDHDLRNKNLFWITKGLSLTGWQVYHHTGEIEFTDSNRPNHS